MNQQFYKFIVTYKKPPTSYLWMNKEDDWFLYLFEDGEVVRDDMSEHFNSLKVEYAELPEGLRIEMEKDGWEENIRGIYVL
ncbi:hypothetical protein [Niabella hirudinis]|uniref:hypothetical protein n=1 Tax=Niabella hirudinis TaxID=1285929 RepID=UPI003EBF0C4D